VGSRRVNPSKTAIFWNNFRLHPLIVFNPDVQKEIAVIITTTPPTADFTQPRTDSPEGMESKDSRLISSDRVEGTEIFDRDGQKVGTVRKMMIDKQSGQVRNVIIGYGGLFGMGEDFYPMPWKALEYNEDKNGYVLGIDRDRLDPEKAPRFKSDQQPNWDDQYEREVTLYYFPA